MKLSPEAFRAHLFLDEMLLRIRPTLETPPGFVVDSRGIVEDVCGKYLNTHGERRDSELQLRSEFEALIYKALDLRPPIQDETTLKSNKDTAPLATWLEAFFNTMADLHPKATELVRLSLLRCNDREIAEQLQIGPALTQFIKDEIRAKLSGGCET